METIATWIEDDREYRFQIGHDQYAESPREWDNMGTLACWHRRYTLGDEQPAEQPCDYRNDLPEGTVVLPVYMYDHSGITIQTEPFSCPWDSGQVGIIYATPRQAMDAGFAPDERERIEQSLRAEIAVYDTFLRGECYHFALESRPVSDCDGCGREHDWDTEDSCCGFLGRDIEQNGMLDHLNEDHARRVREVL